MSEAGAGGEARRGEPSVTTAGQVYQ